jgi:hypothetical protein
LFGGGTVDLGAADATQFGVFKGEDFFQSDDGPPVSEGFEAFWFQAFATASAKDNLTAASVRLPDGTDKTLAVNPDGLELNFVERFDNRVTLDLSYPSGDYTFRLDTASDGLKLISLNLPENFYPNPPRLADLRSRKPSKPTRTSHWPGNRLPKARPTTSWSEHSRRRGRHRFCHGGLSRKAGRARWVGHFTNHPGPHVAIRRHVSRLFAIRQAAAAEHRQLPRRLGCGRIRPANGIHTPNRRHAWADECAVYFESDFLADAGEFGPALSPASLCRSSSASARMRRCSCKTKSTTRPGPPSLSPDQPARR